MLENCSECGGQVSDTATVCPHCGAPLLRRHSGLSRILGLDSVQPKPLLALRWGVIATWGGCYSHAHECTPKDHREPELLRLLVRPYAVFSVIAGRSITIPRWRSRLVRCVSPDPPVDGIGTWCPMASYLAPSFREEGAARRDFHIAHASGRSRLPGLPV